MPTKKTWAEIKASKSKEEWKKRNLAYHRRYNMRLQLKNRAHKLFAALHNIRIVQNPGPADVLADQLNAALRLPYCWGQEDYDHAVSVLNTVEAKLRQYQNRAVPSRGEDFNTLILVTRHLKGTDLEKFAAITEILLYLAAKISMEPVTDLKNTLPNLIFCLLKKPDGYYPKWLEKALYNRIAPMLDKETMTSFVQRFVKNLQYTEECQRVFGNTEIDKKDNVFMDLG